MSSKTVVTLSKGGKGEVSMTIGSIEIPDLWHIAQRIRQGSVDIHREETADSVLKAWHLCHDFKQHIQES